VASDPLIGSTVAGYRIESRIGRGGMSRVYRAEHLRLGRHDALKLLSLELMKDPNFRERFEREWRVAAGIDHPNIIPVFDAGEADGHFYIAMRYVETTDLRALLEREGRLDPPRAARIIGQTASALDAAHQRGLVHRDIKPGNILITAGDHVFLSDFGLAKGREADKSLTRTGYFVGTVDYAAPEQIQGSSALDARTDVYGLGCVAYECLSGARPYQRESELQLMYAHLQDPPPRITDVREDVPPALDLVLAKALAKSKDDRFASCGEFAEAMDGALANGHVAPPAPPTEVTPAPTPRPSFDRRKAAIAGGAVLAALAVIAGLVAVLGGSNDENAGSTTTTPAAALFADSFANPSSGWFRYESPAVRLRYAGGTYEVLVKVPNWRAQADTAFAPGASSLEDVTIAVDAADRGSAQGAYGVICRSTGSDDYYALELGADGLARIGKVGGGQFGVLGTRRVTAPGPATRIQGRCTGGRGGQPAVLVLSVDGRRALTARDGASPYGSGAVGLIVESFARGGVRVSFDDLVVRQAG
jgi:serine/threonine-protein kinase